MISEPTQKLDMRALKLWKINGCIKAFILCIFSFGVAVVPIKMFDLKYWVLALPPVIVILYGTFEIAILPKLRWQRWRYEITESEIDLQRGVFITERTLIPMTRVQHVDTIQGILMRRYGLATVVISTAAGSHEIPALSLEKANEVSQQIAKLAQVHDDVL